MTKPPSPSPFSAITGPARPALFQLANGAVIDLTGGGSNNLSGTYTSTGQGTIELNNGTLNVGTAGATFDFPAGVFQWTGGTITGGGGLLNNGVITINKRKRQGP